MQPHNTNTPAANEAALTEGGSAVRLWLGVLAGVVCMIPLGILLSYAAFLPFLLGIFFFTVFGLLVGAVAFRAASPGQPYARGSVVAAAFVVIVAGGGISLAWEYHDFAEGIATESLRFTPTSALEERSVEQFKADVVDQVNGFLRERYPPGGFIGYVRWVVVSGEVPKGAVEDVDRALSAKQHQSLWVVRVALSVGLLAFGVLSMMLPLSRAGDGSDETHADDVDHVGEDRDDEAPLNEEDGSVQVDAGSSRTGHHANSHSRADVKDPVPSIRTGDSSHG